MSLFDILSALLVLTALFSYINHRFFKLPTTIGIMLLSLVFASVIIFVGDFIPGLRESAAALVESIDFNGVYLNLTQGCRTTPCESLHSCPPSGGWTSRKRRMLQSSEGATHCH